MKKSPHINPLSYDYLSAFCMETSLLLKSGIPITQGLLALSEEENSDEGKKLLNQIFTALDQGSSFYESLEHTGRFPTHLISMVKIGEKTGTLERTLYQLFVYYKKEDSLRKTIKSALLYPLLMILLMITVLLILMIKILPIFQDVFFQLGMDMPPLPLALMTFGGFLAKYSILFLVLLFALALILGCFGQRLRLFQKVWNKTPLSQIIALSRLTAALSLTFSSGYDTEESLELSCELMAHPKMTEKIVLCQQYVKEGLSFADALEKANIIRGTYASMLSIGFLSGSADTVMEEISHRITQQAEEKIDSIVSAIEPSLVILLSLLTGVILLSVMMPILGILSSMG